MGRVWDGDTGGLRGQLQTVDRMRGVANVHGLDGGDGSRLLGKIFEPCNEHGYCRPWAEIAGWAEPGQMYCVFPW